MKATEQYFPVVLFIILNKVVLTFESMDEILKCDHSNEQYFPVVLLLCGTRWFLLLCDHFHEKYQYANIWDGSCKSFSFFNFFLFL